MPFNIDVRKISDTEANLSSSTKVYDNNFQLWPTDGANFGKYKQCDGIHTYSQLAFQDPTVAWGSGGGSGLSQDIIDGLEASESSAYPPSSINPYITGDEVGNELALRLLASSNLSDVASDAAARANLGLPSVYKATITDFAGATVSGVTNQLGGTPAWVNVEGGHLTLTIAGAFTADKTHVDVTSDIQSVVYHVGAQWVSANVIAIWARDSDGALVDPAEDIMVSIEVMP